MVKSNTLQPFNLIFEHNIVTHSVAYIFENSKCNSLEYKNSNEVRDKAINLFKEILKFKTVQTYLDWTNEEVVDILQNLIKCAEKFEDDVAEKRKKFEEKKVLIP